MTATDELLFEGADWDFRMLQRICDACEQVARDELKLDVYPNQIEVITAEQMLDAYSSVGMPLFYKHWSFGKHFAFQEASYRKGLMGLAYEIAINSSPCISYQMEENSATKHTLDAAHAVMSHGIDRYPGKKSLDLRAEEKRAGRRRAHEERPFNDLWRTVPGGKVKTG